MTQHGIGQEFARLTQPYRRELLAYCYRMLGSVDEAEDLVQETYLRAWRFYGDFEERSSLRTWLYRIATNVCLRALERGARRPLPSGLGGPADDPEAPLDPRRPEVPWLQPLPDRMVDPDSGDPGAIVQSRQSLRLALVATLQYLPPRQRAVLILREVLAWRAGEVADLLATTPAAVNSALQRARAQLAELAPDSETMTEPDDPQQQRLLDRYASAFEAADFNALARALAEDAVLEMPPAPTWYAGRDAIRRFLPTRGLRPGDMRLAPISANGQPGFAFYFREYDDVHRANAIEVLTVVGPVITRIVHFVNPELFAGFGLPLTYPDSVANTTPR